MADQERTQEATPRHRARVRALGQVAKSQLAPPAFAILTAAPVAMFVASHASWWLHGFAFAASTCAAQAAHVERSLGCALQVVSGSHLGAVVALAWVAAAACGMLAALACGALGFAPGAVIPRLARLSFGAGLRRLASADSALAAMWSGAVVVALAAAGTSPLVAAIEHAARSGSEHGLLDAVLFGPARLWMRAVAVLAPCAIVEVAVVRKRFSNTVRMTAREVKEERAQTEIRPETKARRRAAGARRSRSLKLAAIRKATAVVTNPDHLAIALQYAPPEVDVPVVVARGADLTAHIVRAVALECDIPIIESAELARMLYARVDVDEPIPEDCYAAVAAVFAWIVRTRGSLRTEGREPA